MRNVAALTLFAVLALAKAKSGHWEIINSTKGILTIDFGVSFRDENHGFIAGAQNGYGNEVLETTDGGQTWKQLNNTNLQKELILFDIVAGDESLLISGLFGEMYSLDDGKTAFKFSYGGMHSECLRKIGKGPQGDRYAVVGTYGGGNESAVAISEDSGKFFVKHTSTEFFAPAGYGSFPSDNIWYISAGSMPQTVADDDQAPPGYEAHVQGSYQAQIVKYDNGKWTTQVAAHNEFAFYGIDCADTQTCCAAASGPSYADIWCTFDGQNWNKTYSSVGTSTEIPSLEQIAFVGKTGVAWASGAKLGRSAPTAIFLETTDFGRTWTEAHDTFFGNIAENIDIVSENVAYATLINPVLSYSQIAKWTSN